MSGRLGAAMWRRYLALGVLVVWVAVAAARLSRLVEAPESPPGAELTPALLSFVRATLPDTAGYLYVLPGEFGADTGTGPRLRYELYPRRYDDVRASADEQSVREVMRREGLRYVVVPDGSAYPAGHWLRTTRDWLRPIALDDRQYVLEAAP
jgi:hypothetical protein